MSIAQDFLPVTVRAPTYPQRDMGLSRIIADSPLYARLGLLLFLAMIPTAAAAILDERLFHGVSVWQKPLKFEFALAVYLLTLAFFARYVPPSFRAGRTYQAFELVVCAAIVAEILWIGAAAHLGVASHFNTDNALFVALYPLMGLAATILTSATTVQAFAIHRNPDTGLSPAVKSGLVAGLALTLPLTLISAGYMSSVGSHWVGGQPSDADGLAIMGWARDGGDLRVAHFFATHAMHIVPAFGLLSATVFGRSNLTPVRLFAIVFALFVLGTFAQALLGQPFLGFIHT